MSQWHIYLIRCSDNSLYTGITTDVDRRFNEHIAGANKGAKYFHAKKPVSVVFHAAMPDKSTALRTEHQIKKCTKQKKEDLVQGNLSLAHILQHHSAP